LTGAVVEVGFRADDEPAIARIAQRPDGTLTGTLTTSAPLDVALDELRFVLAVDDDHSPFLAMAAADELLAHAIIPRRGFRPLRTSVAQSLLHGFAGQLIAAREAWAIERRITAALGTMHEGLLLPLSADELRAASPSVFVKHGLAPKRATALAGAARQLDLDALRRQPIDVAVARLLRQPMIGPWTSALVALNGLGRCAYGIAGDLNLLRLCSNLLGRRASVADTAALLHPYGEWAGLASLHLARHPLAGVRGAHGPAPGATAAEPQM
jgi:3-methyladenine DNA glycosylase/8-oxoguanine DNA glycosylase